MVQKPKSAGHLLFALIVAVKTMQIALGKRQGQIGIQGKRQQVAEAQILAMLHRLKPFRLGPIGVEGNFGQFDSRILIGNAIIRKHPVDLRK